MKNFFLLVFLVIVASRTLFAQATTTPAPPAALELHNPLQALEEPVDALENFNNWQKFQYLMPPPSNDEPSGALFITPSLNCAPSTYNLQSATVSSITRNTSSCSTTNQQDIFYRFVVPVNATSITILATCSSGLDIMYHLYTSSYGYIDCEDRGGGHGRPEQRTFTNLTPGATYLVRLTDYSGASVAPTTYTGTICITYTACTSTVSTPSLSAQGGNTMCEGGSKTISANVCSGCSLEWEDGSSANPRTVNSGGTYTLQVTDACGNTRSSSLTITENQAPSASINNGVSDQDACQGQQVRLTATGGSSYVWGDGNRSSSRTVTSSGMYTVTVTLAGCTAEASINVTINPLPVGAVDEIAPLCQGGQGELMATAGGCSYVWSNGSTDPNIVITASGNYRVTFTDGNNCSAVASRTVQALPLPSFVITSPVNNRNICEGSELTLVANNAAVTWEGDGINGNFMNAPGIGSYTITATLVGTNGCAATQTRTVNVQASPLVAVNEAPFTQVCAGSIQSFTATGGVSYLWSNGQRTATIRTSVSGIYTVTGTSNGCTATAEVEVLVSPAPTATLVANQTNLQSGDLLTLTVNSNDAASVLWEDGNTDFYREFNPIQSTVYRVTITDGNGCTGTANISIAVQTTSGILGNGDIASLRLYPNPSSGMVNVEVTESNSNIVVMDVLGRTMHMGVHSNGLITLDLSTLVSGTYVVRVISETGVAISQAKFIKL